MKYSIGTMLILQKFDGKSLCPFCEIKTTVDERLVDRFLDEAVMEDEIRIEVNEKGFCEKHFKKLYEGKSKLGLALQMHTRFNHIIKQIGTPSNPKQAKKTAEKLRNNNCIICDILNDHMSRYVETVIKMYGAEKGFKEVFEKEKFCLVHYADMLEKCSCAKDVKGFLKTLNTNMKTDNELLSKEIRAFCDAFDYRNKGKTLGDEKYALIKTDVKVYGK